MPQKVGGHGYSPSHKPKRQRIAQFLNTAPAITAATFGTGAVPSSSTVSAPAPVDVGLGDLLIIWLTDVLTPVTFTIAGSSGWTQITSSGQNCQGTLFYKNADPTDVSLSASAGSYTLTPSAAHSTQGIIVHAPGYGFDPVPADAGQYVSAATSTSFPYTGVTTSTDGDTILFFGVTRVSSGAPPVMALPGGFSTLVAQANTTASAAANVGVFLGTQTQATAGATGTQTFTSATGGDGGAFMLALQPVTLATLPDAAAGADSISVSITTQNNFEGGGAAGGTGTGITTGNSGGGSGAAFSSVTIPAGGTFTFDTTGMDPGGTFGGRWQLVSASTGWRAYLQWPAGSTSVACRWVFCFNTLPTVPLLLATIANGSGAQNVQILFNPTGNVIQTRNAAGTSIGSASSAISAGTLYGLEVQLDCGSTITNGTISTQLYALSAPGTLLLNYSSGGATVNAGGSSASPLPIRGQMGNSDVVANLDVTFDDLQFSTGTLTPIGPPTGGSTPVSLADAGAVTDAVQVAATAALADTAGSADAIALAAAVPLPDAGGSTDLITATAAVPLPDVAGVADSSVVTATTSSADTAGAADSLSVSAALSVADVAGAADSLATTQPQALADAAGVADALAVSVAVPLKDAAGAVEVIAETVTLSLADAGGAAELQVIGITQADQAGAVDSLTVAATVALAEQGAAADAIAVGIPQADVAGGSDSLAVTVAAPLADAAGSADQISQGGSQSPVFSDVAGAAETISASAQIAVADAGGAADQLGVSASTGLADAAGAADSTQIAASVHPADVAAGTDLVNVNTAVVLADAGGAADTFTVLAGIAAGDLAAAAETLAVSKQLGLAETAGAADVIAVTIAGAGNTGAVDWEARPYWGRWAITLAGPRWSASPGASRYQTGVVPPRWHAGPASSRWRIIMAEFRPVSAGSKAYVNALWTSDLAGTIIDPTNPLLTVQFAFPVSSGDENNPAAPVTWYAGSWLAGTVVKGFIAQCLVGPSGGVVALTAGVRYDVWSQILGTPEQPRDFVGVLPVTN
jgi:hypothetical protein